MDPFGASGGRMTDSGSESETELLINAVKTRPFLYNRKDPKYKRIYLKKQAWEHISAKIPTFEDASSAERRWNSLRGKFSTELLRTMGNEYDPLGRPLTKWKYFESLGFLRDHVNPRTGVNQPYPNTSYRPTVTEGSNSWSPMPESYQTNNHANESNTDQYYSNLLNMLTNEDDSIDNSTNGNGIELEKVQVPEKITKIEPPIQMTPKAPQTSTFSNNNVSQKTHQSHNQQPKRTSSRIFGEYVGEILEEMDPEDGMEVQMKIMQVIMEAKKKPAEVVNE